MQITYQLHSVVQINSCTLAGSIGRMHMEDLRQQLPSPSWILMKLHQEPENIQLGEFIRRYVLQSSAYATPYIFKPHSEPTVSQYSNTCSQQVAEPAGTRGSTWPTAWDYSSTKRSPPLPGKRTTSLQIQRYC